MQATTFKFGVMAVMIVGSFRLGAIMRNPAVSKYYTCKCEQQDYRENQKPT